MDTEDSQDAQQQLLRSIFRKRMNLSTSRNSAYISTLPATPVFQFSSNPPYFNLGYYSREGNERSK